MPSALRASAIRERGVVRSQASYITSCAFAVASSPWGPASAARKLSIARLSGNGAAAPVFVEVFEAVFERGCFEIGIPYSCPDFRIIVILWLPTRCRRQSVNGGLADVAEARDLAPFGGVELLGSTADATLLRSSASSC